MLVWVYTISFFIHLHSKYILSNIGVNIEISNSFYFTFKGNDGIQVNIIVDFVWLNFPIFNSFNENDSFLLRDEAQTSSIGLALQMRYFEGIIFGNDIRYNSKHLALDQIIGQPVFITLPDCFHNHMLLLFACHSINIGPFDESNLNFLLKFLFLLFFKPFINIRSNLVLQEFDEGFLVLYSTFIPSLHFFIHILGFSIVRMIEYMLFHAKKPRK